MTKSASDDIARILRALGPEEWRTIENTIAPILAEYAKNLARLAAREAAAAQQVSDAALDAMLDQANLLAVEWAHVRAAELVTEIAETTRDSMRSLLTDGIERGLTNQELAKEISGSYAFSPERSTLIARTESENAGVIEGWRASGQVEGKEWEPDAEACEICLGNAADGVIPIDATFSSGDDAPTAHPNCECTLRAVLVPLDE
jgi:hypothetical protein